MRTVRIVFVALGATLALALAACDQTEVSGVGEKASAAMAGTDGASMGTVFLEQGPNGVLVSAEVNGLTPGGHGFHVHSVGSCSPDFSAAGGHFNVSGEGHGFMHEDGSHGGDLPNIYAGGRRHRPRRCLLRRHNAGRGCRSLRLRRRWLGHHHPCQAGYLWRGSGRRRPRGLWGDLTGIEVTKWRTPQAGRVFGGSAKLIVIDPATGVWTAGSDPRSDGQAGAV